MREHTFYRSDFRMVQDGSGDDFFDELLEALGIPEEKREGIDEITVNIELLEVQS